MVSRDAPTSSPPCRPRDRAFERPLSLAGLSLAPQSDRPLAASGWRCRVTLSDGSAAAQEQVGQCGTATYAPKSLLAVGAVKAGAAERCGDEKPPCPCGGIPLFWDSGGQGTERCWVEIERSGRPSDPRLRLEPTPCSSLSCKVRRVPDRRRSQGCQRGKHSGGEQSDEWRWHEIGLPKPARCKPLWSLENSRGEGAE